MEELTINTLVTQLKSFNQQITEFKLNISNKNVLAFVGNTRNGKSTLINYVLENNLAGVESSRHFVIEANNFKGPSIKHGSVSHTRSPSIWKSNHYSNTLIVDFPGFDDNRGSLYNITNAIFLNQLQFANSVRFVVVCSVNDILGDNIGEFTKVMKIMECSVQDFNSISLIFTKDKNENTVEDIVSMLQAKILDVPQIVVNRNLITHLVANIEKIGLFRMPTRSGALTNEINCNIRGAINSSGSTKFIWKFNTVDGARCCLLSLYNKIVWEIDFNDVLDKLKQPYKEWFSIDKYVFASIEEELNTTKEQLRSLFERIQIEESLDLATVEDLFVSIVNLLRQGLSENLESSIIFLKFMDELSLLDHCVKQSLIKNYKSALGSLKRQIVKLFDKIEAELRAREDETVKAMAAAIQADVAKKLLAASAVILPTVKTALDMFGCNLEQFSYEMLKLPQVAGALAVTGIGAVAGGYLMHYYQTVIQRQKLREEQGRK